MEKVKRTLIKIVKAISLNRIRGRKLAHGSDLKWWWTPWTNSFNHNGWIYLSLKWMTRFYNTAKH